jgi:hypothetical protein
MPPREIVAARLPIGARHSIFDLFRRKPARGEVTYTISSAKPQAMVDRRGAARRRTRLRSGKVLDRANEFLVETTIIDRSAGGLRLRLARDCSVPEIFHLFDDESETIFAFRLIWRSQNTLGARFRQNAPIAATRRQIIELRGKFYAIKN